MDLHVEIATPVKIAQNEGSAVLDAAKDLVFGSVIPLIIGLALYTPSLTCSIVDCRHGSKGL